MENVRIVQQKHWHCVPACLESLFFDNDIGINKTQDEIAQDNPDVFRAGVLVDFLKLGNVFKRYGVEVDFITCGEKEYDFEKLKQIAANPNNKILLFWRCRTKHCVRFVGIRQNGDIEVMDPQVGKIVMYDTRKQAELDLGIVYFAKK